MRKNARRVASSRKYLDLTMLKCLSLGADSIFIPGDIDVFKTICYIAYCYISFGVKEKTAVISRKSFKHMFGANGHHMIYSDSLFIR